MQGSAQADSGFYLQQMSQSTNDTGINWQLLAIRALLKEGKTQQAAELFSQLPQDLNDAQRHEQTLLSAELKVAQKITTARRRSSAPSISARWIKPAGPFLAGRYHR